MNTLFGNWLLAVALFAAVCWYCVWSDQRQIDSLAARYGAAAPAAPGH